MGVKFFIVFDFFGFSFLMIIKIVFFCYIFDLKFDKLLLLYYYQVEKIVYIGYWYIFIFYYWILYVDFINLFILKIIEI